MLSWLLWRALEPSPLVLTNLILTRTPPHNPDAAARKCPQPPSALSPRLPHGVFRPSTIQLYHVMFCTIRQRRVMFCPTLVKSIGYKLRAGRICQIEQGQR